MFPSRLLLIFLLAGALALVGCERGGVFPPSYSRVRVTDPRGLLVADWIAEGYVLRTESGYRFRAVERLSGEPNPQRQRYPHGRIVDVSGPNIVVARCGKPYWLYEMEEAGGEYK